jgi:hypothetical protein
MVPAITGLSLLACTIVKKGSALCITPVIPAFSCSFFVFANSPHVALVVPVASTTQWPTHERLCG